MRLLIHNKNYFGIFIDVRHIVELMSLYRQIFGKLDIEHVD